MIKLNAGRFRTLMHSCRLCLIHECGAGAGGVKSGERGAREEEEEEGEVPQVDPHLLVDSARSQKVLPFLFSHPASLIILAPTLFFCSAPTLLSIYKTLDTQRFRLTLPSISSVSCMLGVFSTPVIVLTFYYSYFMHSHLALRNQETLFLDFSSTSPSIPIILISLHTHTAPPSDPSLLPLPR